MTRGSPPSPDTPETTSLRSSTTATRGAAPIWLATGGPEGDSHFLSLRGLENWLRREARAAIADYLPSVASRIGQQPGRVYVMGQRTKWGNCSSRRNLSFNWRLILAPYFVLRYLVAHEVVHLAVPDHSAKFWLTVQSVCPETERAKQWLSRHHAQLTVDLAGVLEPACSAREEKQP